MLAGSEIGSRAERTRAALALCSDPGLDSARSVSTVDVEIRELEMTLLRPETRGSPSELNRLLADGFVEFGSSGRVFTKAQVIAALDADPTSPEMPVLDDFQTRELAPDVVLATYRCGRSLRSSIWTHDGTSWRIVFHQGTPAPTSGGPGA